jgi:hypothetical protein
MNEGEDAQNGEDGSENNWSLPKGIELFEVSAKDGQGALSPVRSNHFETYDCMRARRSKPLSPPSLINNSPTGSNRSGTRAERA